MSRVLKRVPGGIPARHNVVRTHCFTNFFILEIESKFRAAYEVEIASELPSSGTGVRYFPAVESLRGQLYETALKLTSRDGLAW